MSKNNNIKGGKADKMTAKNIADKFGVSIDKVEKELEMGVRVEMEHVDDEKLSREIAMDHLVEFPDYYSRLKDMEKEADDKWKDKVSESTTSLIKKLLREGVDLSVADESPDKVKFIIKLNGREAGFVECSNNADIDKAIEVSNFSLKENYRHNTVNLAKDVIIALWKKYEDAQTILLTPTSKSRMFWEKVGATRLNDSYHMIRRGH